MGTCSQLCILVVIGATGCNQLLGIHDYVGIDGGIVMMPTSGVASVGRTRLSGLRTPGTDPRKFDNG
ncbi:MAG TPA: hypothetical protein VF403_25255 [Kofleriaceae bacterium]